MKNIKSLSSAKIIMRMLYPKKRFSLFQICRKFVMKDNRFISRLMIINCLYELARENICSCSDILEGDKRKWRLTPEGRTIAFSYIVGTEDKNEI